MVGIKMISTIGLQYMKLVRPKTVFAKPFPSLLETEARSYSKENNYRRKPFYKSSNEGPNVSQYVGPSPIEVAHEKISDYLLKNNPKTFEEWQEAKEHFYMEIPLLTDVNFSSIILSVLMGKNKYLLAEDFMKYMKDSNIKPNSLTYLQYMSICGRNVEHFGQDEIFKVFSKVESLICSLPVLDKKRATFIIQGLCGTDRWRSAFDYLKKIPDGPNVEIKCSLASAAVRNGDENLAWEILTKWIKDDETMTKQCVGEFLKYANYLQLKYDLGADKFLVKFFKYLEERDIIINANEAHLVEDYFKHHSSKWKISYTKITRNAECTMCKSKVNFIQLSDQEFEHLRTSFLEKSVKKKDIFINTTDKEFNRYIKYLDRHKPFHIVIDGLNVAYTVQESKNPRSLAYHLFRVVKHIANKHRKILILGREQMTGWPENIMKRITQKAHLFLTSNASQDDPFTLYAALASGPHTCVLTMDLMRDHMNRLNNQKLINLFKKWQQSHQIIMGVDHEELQFMSPLKHSITTQGSMENGWHIPVENNFIRDPYEELNNWLCIKRVL